MGESKNVVERGFTLLGSVVALILGILTLLDRLPGASGPRLDTRFSFGDAISLTLAPALETTLSPWTQPFPLPLSITNIGNKSANDVELAIVCPVGLRLSSSTTDWRTERVSTGQGERSLLRTFIPELHPGNQVQLGDSLFVICENTLFIPLHFKTNDGHSISTTASSVVTYELEVRLSARDMQQATRNLYITVGSAAGLDSTAHSYYEVRQDTARGTTTLVRRRGHPRKSLAVTHAPEGGYLVAP